MSNSSIRGVFVCTAALLAAVLGDALVEGISNSGLLWRGHYTDLSSLDLLPVFILAAASAVVTLALLVRHHLAPWPRSMVRTLLRETSRFLVPWEIARLLPTIFALQMLVLFCMETAEQFVVYGHTFGGTLWLGAPVVASLFLHALLSGACAFTLAKCLSVLADPLTRIVKGIVARFVALVRTRPTILSLTERIVCVLSLITTASRVERGPPLSAALS